MIDRWTGEDHDYFKLLAVEPDIRTGGLSVPGGGLTDVLTRMDLHAVSDPIMYEILGPIVPVEPAEGKQVVGGGPMRAKVSFVRRAKRDVVEFDEGMGSRPTRHPGRTPPVRPSGVTSPIPMLPGGSLGGSCE